MKILKQKYRTKYFIQKKMYDYALEEKENERFFNFECYHNFKVIKLSELNKEVYNHRRDLINRKYKQLQFILSTIK